MRRAQFSGQRLFVAAAGDGDRPEPHLGCELNGEVPETADSQDRDGVSGSRTAVPKSVKGCYSGAHERACIGRLKSLGNQSQRFSRDDNVIRIPAVVSDARDLRSQLASNEIPAAAGRAMPTMPAMPTDADSLPGLQEGDVVANRVDDSGNFVSGNPRKLNARPQPVFGKQIAVTDPAGLNFDPDKSSVRDGYGALHQLEWAAGSRHLNNSHRGHSICLSIAR
jgi:hypothetical protein